MKQLTFSIIPIPPFRLDLTAWALRRRPQNLVDRWDGTTYHRVLPFDDVPVEVAIRQTISRSAPLLNICLTAERLRPEFKHEAKALVEKMFGLQVDLAPFYQMAVGIQNSRLVEKFRGVKPPRFPAIFERLANAYACQQLSLTVGLGLLSRLARLRFEPDAKGWNPLRFSSPTGSAESYTDSIPRARLQ